MIPTNEHPDSPLDNAPDRRISGSRDQLPVTAAALKALEQEREQLRASKHGEIRDRIRAARQHGEGHNNDEYLAILEDAAVVDARLARIEQVLARATVVDLGDLDGTVAIGSLVTLYDLRTGDTLEYVVTGAHAAAGAGAVSAISPVGVALLGRSAGDVVQVQLPRGRTRELEVLAVSRPATA